MADRPDELVSELLSDHAGDWDRAGRLPADVVRELARAGLLCPDVPVDAGGRGLSSVELGEFTAHVGSLCSSVRSLLTSQGMAAWAVRRFGTAGQRADVQRRLATGEVAAIAFSEAEAGSDLAAMTTRIDTDGDRVTVTGTKVWVTGARYADLVLVVGRYGDAGAAVLVPTGTPGVRVTPVADPLGCRAAGHAEVALDGVQLPAGHLLGGTGLPLEWLVASVLAHGRLSVAWGCVGILRGCGTAAARHAAARKQFGKPLADHQLVARHLAELLVAERAATRMCEHASRCWDDGSPEQVSAVVAAKHFAATQAARGASAAVQVLGSAAGSDGHVAARGYRDAKLMEIIEGSSEISQLLLSRHAVQLWA